MHDAVCANVKRSNGTSLAATNFKGTPTLAEGFSPCTVGTLYTTAPSAPNPTH